MFSPDGKWLMTHSPCRLWAVGIWSEPRQVGGFGLGFSPDGRVLLVRDENRVLQLVDTQSLRSARLESPDLSESAWGTFSPDGSRLVVTTNDGPSARVWDLRAIRRRLAEMGLDWDAPAYSDDTPADYRAPALPPLQVDFGPLLARAVDEDIEPLVASGNQLAREGRWDEAAACSSREPLRPDGPRSNTLVRGAILQLAVGDDAGYRATCQQMVEGWRRTKNVFWLELSGTPSFWPPCPARRLRRRSHSRRAKARTAQDTLVRTRLGLALPVPAGLPRRSRSWRRVQE